jgi:hypothetical protein
MANIPTRIADRLQTGLKRFQTILQTAKSRDVNESDTVIIITDILADVLGYDKYSEITSEFVIRGTYCDLATKIDGKLQYLIEVKAINSDLKDSYVKQAVDYAANQGIDWVVLTNGIEWRAYKIIFNKPIDQELVLEFDILKLNPKNEENLELLYFLSREGWIKSTISAYHSQKQVLSRFYIGAIILSDTVIDTIRRELKKISPDIKIENEQIQRVLTQEVIKRDVVEGEKAEEAIRKINKTFTRIQKMREKERNKKIESTQDEDVAEIETPPIDNRIN